MKHEAGAAQRRRDVVMIAHRVQPLVRLGAQRRPRRRVDARAARLGGQRRALAEKSTRASSSLRDGTSAKPRHQSRPHTLQSPPM